MQLRKRQHRSEIRTELERINKSTSFSDFQSEEKNILRFDRLFVFGCRSVSTESFLGSN
jgi:hypothetical protein